MSAQIEITAFTKRGGPLTKRVFLGDDGNIISDGSACVMPGGTACRARFDNMHVFAEYISSLASNEAIALGMLRSDLPDKVEVTTKGKLNGVAQPGIIGRTGSHISYSAGKPALALLDYDTKGMPPDVQARLDELGGYWAALLLVVPELATVAQVTRHSTSAGIIRADTKERLRGSNGLHVYVLVKDGADVPRFLRVLHARCWLHGFGWLMVGAGGQMLERSIVDRMVYTPERLVFEGPPVLDPPLEQDQASRLPIVAEGAALDTMAVCPPLTTVEQARLRELRAKEKHQLTPRAAKAREDFISTQSKRLAERTGMLAERAALVIARQCRGILLPDVALPFDDAELAGITVADVLADPARFEGMTLTTTTRRITRARRSRARCAARSPRGAPGRRAHRQAPVDAPRRSSEGPQLLRAPRSTHARQRARSGSPRRARGTRGQAMGAADVTDTTAVAEVLELVQAVSRLVPDWQRPERFHEAKSEILAALRRLSRRLALEPEPRGLPVPFSRPVVVAAPIAPSLPAPPLPAPLRFVRFSHLLPSVLPAQPLRPLPAIALVMAPSPPRLNPRRASARRHRFPKPPRLAPAAQPQLPLRGDHG